MQSSPLNSARARLRATIVGALILPAAVLLAGCAEDRSHLLPGSTAEEISAKLDLVRELADSDDCLGAIDAAQQVTRQIESLGTGVDARLRRSLREGASRLVLTIQKNCHPSETTTPPAETTLPEVETTTGPTGATGDTLGATGEAGPTGPTGNDDQDSGGSGPGSGGDNSGSEGSGGNRGGSTPGTGGGTGTGSGGSAGGGSRPGGSSGDNGGSGGTGSGTGGVGPPGG